jgi:hypothetical protein
MFDKLFLNPVQGALCCCQTSLRTSHTLNRKSIIHPRNYTAATLSLARAVETRWFLDFVLDRRSRKSPNWTMQRAIRTHLLLCPRQWYIRCWQLLILLGVESCASTLLRGQGHKTWVHFPNPRPAILTRVVFLESKFQGDTFLDLIESFLLARLLWNIKTLRCYESSLGSLHHSSLPPIWSLHEYPLNNVYYLFMYPCLCDWISSNPRNISRLDLVNRKKSPRLYLYMEEHQPLHPHPRPTLMQAMDD